VTNWFELAIASLNVVISLIGLVLILRGLRQFRGGILAKSLRRAIPVGVLLFLFFVTEALVAMEILPRDTPIDDILGTLFMLGLLYVTYGFEHDWTHLKSAPEKAKTIEN